MATGDITIDEGSTTNLPTYTITEDAVTKNIPRSAINNSSGTEIDFNSGNKSAATIRVVLATDQPALTNKLLVTPDLPSGASTAANQTTIIGHVDGIETVLGTIDTDTGNISTKIDTIAGAVSGTEMQVDVVAALPAGTNLVGKVSASDETSTIYDGATALTPKFATIAASTSGDNTIVAAVVGKKIRVLAVQVNASAAVNYKWQSGAGGTDITGLNYAAANGGYVLPYSPIGWFETASNTLLNLNLSAANAVGGSITYIEV